MIPRSSGVASLARSGQPRADQDRIFHPVQKVTERRRTRDDFIENAKRSRRRRGGSAAPMFRDINASDGDADDASDGDGASAGRDRSAGRHNIPTSDNIAGSGRSCPSD
jgi:hypothetical protein